MPNNDVLQLIDATVVKNGVRVLDCLTLTIRGGEHTAILGPNGAGKSTLINLLTHQDRPLAREDADDAPPIEVFGSSRWDVFELRSRLGLVSPDLQQRFVGGNSEGYITGEQAVLSGLLATYGIVRREKLTTDMRERAAAALARVGAQHLGAKFLNEMSTGEARRVMIARALVTTPDALVLDEPTAGLDLLARRRFLEDIRSIARGGTTVIFVTHHVEDIIPEVGRVILLKHGRVNLDGPKAAVLTAGHLSALFDAPVVLHRVGEYFFAGADMSEVR